LAPKIMMRALGWTGIGSSTTRLIPSGMKW
jgi:hypothetical protein